MKPCSAIRNLNYAVFLAFVVSLFLSSCSKKPVELYDEGMKSFVAGKYEEAQESFSDGIRKGGSDSLYAGFIAANLVTGKYAGINSAYNDFSDGIHKLLVRLYGERAMKMLSAVDPLIPYKATGGNKLPQDFPQTIEIQAIADREGFAAIKEQIDKIVRH